MVPDSCFFNGCAGVFFYEHRVGIDLEPITRPSLRPFVPFTRPPALVLVRNKLPFLLRRQSTFPLILTCRSPKQGSQSRPRQPPILHGAYVRRRPTHRQRGSPRPLRDRKAARSKAARAGHDTDERFGFTHIFFLPFVTDTGVSEGGAISVQASSGTVAKCYLWARISTLSGLILARSIHAVHRQRPVMGPISPVNRLYQRLVQGRAPLEHINPKVLSPKNGMP